MKLFAYPLWFERIFPKAQRLKNLQRTFYQGIIGERRPPTDNSFIRTNSY
jgi:hypothetical protein